MLEEGTCESVNGVVLEKGTCDASVGCRIEVNSSHGSCES